ncbi:hypothetical protein HPP92_000853 [Vanilla planifolia]|uniref:BHLH domain-containing protein n=1 Tax=Vanilla planifolia TaxID=51239 RepID=A0A835VET9_VANPL|nr:hypothetical protein HPP92_000853 [Vanilla planifolia]
MPRRPREISFDNTIDFVESVLDGLGDCKGNYLDPVTGKQRYKSKNLEAERRRRSKLNQKLFSLRALVPNISKMSKESTLTDAVDYIKQLQTQVVHLRIALSNEQIDEGEKRRSPSSTESKFPEEAVTRFQGMVELRSMGKNKFHLKVTSEMKIGGFTKLLEAIAHLGLEIIEVSSVAFSGISLAVFCLESKDGAELQIGDAKRALCSVVGAS